MGKKKWSGPNAKRRHNHKPKRQQQKNKKFDSDSTERHRPKRDSNAPRENQAQSAENYSNWIQKCSLFEKDVGITEYSGETVGFTGVIKARFSDFQVNEIDLDGNVTKLTDLKLPTKCIDPDETDPECVEKVRKLIGEEVWKKIDDIAVGPKSKPSDPIEIDVTAMDKEQRSLIHNTVKTVHGPAVIGSTYERNGNKWIKFAKFTKKNARDQRVKWLWPHEYLYFIVHKENLDTMFAATNLAQNLSVNVSALSYAGTKDKRGKTSQWMCIRKREPEKIARAAEKLTNIHVGNFMFKATPLKLGLLKGNRFRVALRHITVPESVIETSMDNFKANGFINYYGLQRFGNCASIPTHRIGLTLLRGQFKEAVELILKPRDGESHFMRQVREFWWSKRDATGALKLLFKSNKSVEAKLLTGLSRHGANDFVNALENVPRNMRLLYIHAYQSLVWNEIVSRRIKTFGNAIQVGDLVFVDSVDENVLIEESELSAEENDAEGNDADENDDNEADDSSEPMVTDKTNLPNEPEISRFKAMVKALTAEDIASGSYSIFDIVLPLPGHDITYPSNECKSWFDQRLTQDGLSSEKLKSKQKTYSLGGAYRKVFIKPENLSWKLQPYENETDNLIVSDLDELNETTLTEYPDGKLTALIIDFCLPSSSYATMALREILKADTSKSNQTEINDEATKEAKKASCVPADDGMVGLEECKKRGLDADNDDDENVKKQKVE